MKVALRSVSTADVELLLRWENDEQALAVNTEKTAYSRTDIQNLIASSIFTGLDSLLELRQARFIIEVEGRPVGTVDLFSLDKDRRSAGVGILIASSDDRQKGFALEALNLLEEKSQKMHLWLLHCIVQKANVASLRLFEKAGYKQVSHLSTSDQLLYLERCLKK